jgi:hypothetical protein
MFDVLREGCIPIFRYLVVIILKDILFLIFSGDS